MSHYSDHLNEDGDMPRLPERHDTVLTVQGTLTAGQFDRLVATLTAAVTDQQLPVTISLFVRQAATAMNAHIAGQLGTSND